MEPYVSTGLFACAVVSTAHWLGAGWVGEMWLGMPLGLWCVGAAAGASWLRARKKARRGFSGSGEEPASEYRMTVSGVSGSRAAEMGSLFAERVREKLTSDVGAGVRRWMSHPIYAMNKAGDKDRPGADDEQDIQAVEDRAAEMVERAAEEPARTGFLRGARGPSNRIGVTGPEDVVETFVAQAREEGLGETKFEPIAGEVSEPEECAKRALAGVVSFTPAGQTAIVLPEQRGRAAAWEDWAVRLPLSYPTMFPPRVDPARIVCGPVRTKSARETRLIVRMAEAAAISAQLEARTGSRRSAGSAAAHQQRMAGAMMALARTFASDWWGEHGGTGCVPACRAAARGIGAWLSMWEGKMDERERRRWLEVCAAFHSDEPESQLRLAAAQIGAFEDERAMGSLKRAYDLLRGTGELPVSDPLAFVMAEIELGTFTSMSLGRVAAGLTVAWATTPNESLDYLRDDLVEDLRHSGKLLGRDQDHAFLKRVMAQMDEMRSESMPLRVRAA